MSLIAAGAIAVAWTVDAAFGEPRDAWHPVAWLGRLLGPVGRWLRDRTALVAFVGGGVTWCIGAVGIGAGAWWISKGLASLHPLFAIIASGLLMKPAFAWRMLRDEVLAVEAALARSLDEGRANVARLCSRDVTSMDAGAVRETAIETLAENLADSLVAPLLWFVLAGLPGAAVYRFANTADAMWGYRGRYEWAGKWAARADDVLSWLPARLAALSIACAAYTVPRGLRREAARTPSPNGGWPMAAIALCLDVRLRKPGVYVLHASGRPPAADDLTRAVRIATLAAWMTVVVAIVASLALPRWP